MGCGLATIAMLTGETYQQVKQRLSDYKHLQVGENRGINYYDLLDELQEHGFWAQRKYRLMFGGDLSREEWPLRPWAPVHIVQVTVSEGGPSHFIIMLKDGTILDPLTTSTRTLTDYSRIDIMIGLQWEAQS